MPLLYLAMQTLMELQIVAHKVDGYDASGSANQVDGDPVPVPHFGAALTVAQFHELAQKVKAAGVQFVIEPHLRFQGQPGEQVSVARTGWCWGRRGGGGGLVCPTGVSAELLTLQKII
jgi:hypothetical protein